MTSDNLGNKVNQTWNKLFLFLYRNDGVHTMGELVNEWVEILMVTNCDMKMPDTRYKSRNWP